MILNFRYIHKMESKDMNLDKSWEIRMEAALCEDEKELHKMRIHFYYTTGLLSNQILCKKKIEIVEQLRLDNLTYMSQEDIAMTTDYLRNKS